MHAFVANGSRRLQRGQSLAETCVACIVLIPLAIGIVYLGQYIHLNQTTQMVAREAAWDAAVSPQLYGLKPLDTSGEQTRLQSRSFADPAAVIQTGAKVSGSFADTLLTDYAGNQLLRPDQLTLSVYQNSKTPGVEGQIDSLVGKVSSALSGLDLNASGRFPPDPNGYITARADAKAARATRFDPLDQMNLDFHSQTVLLADAWDADGAGENDANGEDNSNTLPIPDRSVRRSVALLAPSTVIFGGPLGKLVDTVSHIIGEVPGIDDFFPGLDKLQLGRTSPEVIPPDKLATYKQ